MEVKLWLPLDEDWRFPGYFDPRRLPDNAALLKKQTYGQVEGLMKNYGKIDILCYDGGWLAHKGADADAAGVSSR